MSGKKKFSDEFKLAIVQEYLSGENGGFRILSAKNEYLKKLIALIQEREKLEQKKK